MKRFILFPICAFLLPCMLFSLSATYPFIARKGDAAFEWQLNENIPVKVTGSGRVLSVSISKNRKYIAVLTSSGIEIFDYQNLRFIKKLMTQKKVKTIRFTENDDFLAIHYQSGIIRWGIFNFSFRKIKRLPEQENHPAAFTISGYQLKIHDGQTTKTIRRQTPVSPFFAFHNQKYAASADENGVLYEFSSDNPVYVQSRVYDVSGDLIDISQERGFAIIKEGEDQLIQQLSTGNTLLKFSRSAFISFAKHATGFYVKAEGNTLILENFRGLVMQKKIFPASIQFVSVNVHGIAVIADKTYLLGYDFKEKLTDSTKNGKAYPLSNGLFTLTSKVQGIHSLYEITLAGKNLRGRTTHDNVFFDGEIMSFTVPGGMNWKKTGEALWNHVPGAEKIFLLGNTIAAVKQKRVYLSIQNKFQECYIFPIEKSITRGNTLFYMSQNALHSLELSPQVINLLISITPEALIKKAEDLNAHSFARSLEYSHLLRLFPGNRKAIEGAALFFFTIEDYENAFTLYRRILNRAGRKPENDKNAGISAFKLKKYAEAVQSLSRALISLPRDPLLHYYLGTTYYRLNQYPAAIRHLNLSIRFDQSYMNAYQNLGLLYKKIRNYPMAENTYFKGLAINENSHDLNFNLGRLYELQNKLPLALLFLKKAFSLKATDHIYSYQVAQIYIKMSQWDKALEFLKTTLSLNPEYAPAQYNLGWIYEKHKNSPVLARYHYRFFLELEPNSPYRRQIQHFMNSR